MADICEYEVWASFKSIIHANEEPLLADIRNKIESGEYKDAADVMCSITYYSIYRYEMENLRMQVHYEQAF